MKKKLVQNRLEVRARGDGGQALGLNMQVKNLIPSGTGLSMLSFTVESERA